MRRSRSQLNRMWVVGIAVAGLVVAAAVTPAAAAEDDASSFTATPVTPQGPAEESAKSASGRLAQSDEDLLKRSDAAVTPVMVKVDVDPVASYAGGIDGLAATSPEVTGVSISDGSPAIDAYTAHVEATIAAAQAQALALIPSAKLLASYTTVYGGYAMTIPANRAKDLIKLDSVAAVQSNELLQATSVGEASANSLTSATASAVVPSAAPIGSPAPDADATTFIGADKIWPSLGGRDKAGQGVIVGVIDTGIWPEHPMLDDNGIPTPAGGPWKCEFGDGGAAFTCNDKMLGAYAFLDTYQAIRGPLGAEDFCASGVCSARDSEGHGTHTATTAVGDYVTSAPLFGIERGPISGVAPGASLIAYRALGPTGGYPSDLVAAAGQAVLDGVDVLNYSISGSADPYDAMELAFLDAYAAGVTVNSSAGNSGPGASTANHASPWTTTVGASSFDRAFTSTLVLTSSDGATFSKQGGTITSGVTSKPVVLASTVPGHASDANCDQPFQAGTVVDQVVFCVRSPGRVLKGFNVLQGGAAGMILANPAAADVETDSHFLPAIHLDGPNDDVVAFITGHPNVTATWTTGQATVAQGDIMTPFSSRGPIGDWLKPDITAPGIQVLAGQTPAPSEIPSGPSGQLYQSIAGTSMAAPHAAGVSALVKAAHPTWTPGQIKSALMTSSLQSVVNPGGAAAGVFDRGAGSIRADRAVAPVLTISETAADFYASAGDAFHRIDLNIASVYADPLPGAVSTKRTVTNVSGASQVFTVSAKGAGGLRVIATPAVFTLAAGKSRDVTVIVDGLNAEDGWHEGQVTIKPAKSGLSAVVLPVAANVREADVSLTQSCQPTTILKNATTTCTVAAANFMPVPVKAKIDVASNPLLQTKSVTAPATKTILGAAWSGTLSPALPPTVTGITVTPTALPAGYLPLELFTGIPLQAFGDDAIQNFNVPEFRYGGEVYSSIGVVSNGYLVVGGGTNADVLFEPNGIPSPAAPNNVLAPLWTDLNPQNAAAGDGIRVGVLTDGATYWIVVDWENVPTFAGNAVNSFEVWIETGANEAITYAYGADPVGDTDAGMAVAAENRDGTSGAALTTLPTSAEGVQVSTAPPVAGGVVTFDYTLKGLVKGTWLTWAQLKSDALRAVPMEQTKITVK